VAGGKHGEGKKGTKKYLPNYGWDALSADATPKPIESQKKGSSGKSDGPVLSALQKCDENRDDVSSTLTIEEEGSVYFQDALERHNENHPQIVLALKHRTCDSQMDAKFVVHCSEQALPNLLSEGQVYPSTADCGSMLNLEGIQGARPRLRMPIQENPQGARSFLRISK
jgi:hypothetical protein